VFLTPSEAEVSPITTAYDGGELGLLITPDSGELAGNVSTGAAGTAFVSSTNAFLINPGTSGAAVNSNDQAAAASGSWRVDLSSTDYYGASTVTGNFIAGIASSALAIDSLVAGLGAIQVANYSGSNVNMAINFANSTWSGNVYGGAGRGGHTYTVNGGTVSGADFSATTENITASYTQYSSPINVVSGQINGSVFGSAAATVGGIYDVTTNDDGTYRDVGLFTGTLQERAQLVSFDLTPIPPIDLPPAPTNGATFTAQ
ncbi:MAG: transferrin-binding protein-like solute binding protein, partial [Gammaproteobacteria bacterium]|nr:transferrin-binding protein-like solute binding protein [Gammaproteobacteria bacterium]